MKSALEFATCKMALATLALAAVVAKPALASPTYITFDCPGVESAQPTGINDNGVVAGYCGTSGFVRSTDGTIVTFSVPGANATYVHGINGNGDVVGHYIYMGATAQGYVRTPDGTLTTFNVIYATAINDMGIITGLAEDGDGFIRSADGAITEFALPGASETLPEAINNTGEITGTAALNKCCGQLRGFFRTAGGKLIEFKAPGNVTEAYGINSHGDVSGSYESGGFLRSKDGLITTFQVVKPRFLIYPKINDHREIVGSYEKEEINYPCDQGCTGFLRTKNGATEKIKVPVHGNAEPVAINNKGWIAGSYVTTVGGAPHGFLRTP